MEEMELMQKLERSLHDGRSAKWGRGASTSQQERRSQLMAHGRRELMRSETPFPQDHACALRPSPSSPAGTPSSHIACRQLALLPRLGFRFSGDDMLITFID